MKIDTILPEIKEDVKSMFHSEENAERMANNSNLEEILKSWIEDEQIITHKVSDKSNAILIITKSEDDLYSLYRFFPTYDKWNVSVDVQEKPLVDVLNNLLYYR